MSRLMPSAMTRPRPLGCREGPRKQDGSRTAPGIRGRTSSHVAGTIRRTSAGLALAIAAASALGACGSSSHHKGQATTTQSGVPSELAKLARGSTAPASGLHAATLKLSTPAVFLTGGIESRYTCHGQNISPPFKWYGVAAAAPHAQELLVFVRTVSHGKILTNWALAGLPPSLSGVKAGQTPPGAIVGRNSSGKIGYSLCPPAEALMTFGVYAVPRKLRLKRGFDADSVRPVLEAAETQWGGMTFSAYPPSKHRP